MKPPLKSLSIWKLFLMFIFIIVVPYLPLLVSAHWGWWEGWVYAMIGILGFVISRVLVAQRHPDLLQERARFFEQQDAKPWDKLLSPIVGMGSALIPLVAGLDARYDWSGTFDVEVKSLALLVILAGYLIGSYALIENRFFSGVVRIQFERSHQVVSSGPYRWMRHPGYAGALWCYLATPFFLDSSWALLPAVLISGMIVLRTELEDRTLQEEMYGYKEYVLKVRYRLIPGVW